MCMSACKFLYVFVHVIMCACLHASAYKFTVTRKMSIKVEIGVIFFYVWHYGASLALADVKTSPPLSLILTKLTYDSADMSDSR